MTTQELINYVKTEKRIAEKALMLELATGRWLKDADNKKYDLFTLLDYEIDLTLCLLKMQKHFDKKSQSFAWIEYALIYEFEIR